MPGYEVFQGKDYHEYGAEPGTYQDMPLEPEGWYYIVADDPVGPFPTEADAMYDLKCEYGTRVIFKQDRGEIMAFLLDVPSNYGRVVCYAHIGQHSEADLSYARACKPAKPEQYKDLQEELESIGYVLTIRRKFPSGFVQGSSGIRIP